MFDNLSFFNLLSGSTISWVGIFVALAIAFVLGMIIAFVYQKCNAGFSYEKSFGFTLVLITIIIAAIMLTIGSNVALSLGLVGSLSIIRFRTAVKNTIDMSFLFWAICEGLAAGAGQYHIALISLIVIGVVIYLVTKTNILAKTNTDYILVVAVEDADAEREISAVLKHNGLLWKIKSRFANEAGGEITYSIFAKKLLDINQVVNGVNKLQGVKNVSLLSPETTSFI